VRPEADCITRRIVDTPSTVWLERRLSTYVEDALTKQPYSFIPSLVRAQGDHRRLDLRFRGTRMGPGEATAYLGERALLRLKATEKELKLLGPVKNVERPSPEGRVEARFAANPVNAVIDRQLAFKFPDSATRSAVVGAAGEPLAELAKQIAAVQTMPKPPALGQEVDAVSIDIDGALCVIEIKAGSDVGGIGWAPLQVAVYAALMRRWIDCDPGGAHAELSAMMDDRVSLGLAEHRVLKQPIPVRAMVAIGDLGDEISPAARQRAIAVSSALVKLGAPFSVLCDFWIVDSCGAATKPHWAPFA
jgi:hypothetical protein